MQKRGRAAVAGAIGVLAAFSFSELVAGVVVSAPSLVEAVGNVVIDNVPTPIKDWAIAVFRTYDKLALIVGIVVVGAAIGALVGILSRKSRWLAVVAFVAFGGLGASAAIGDGNPPAPSVLVAAAAVVAGLAVFAYLSRRSGDQETAHDPSRRAFLAAAGASLLLAVVAVGTGRFLTERARRIAARRDGVAFPRPAAAVAPPEPGMQFEVEGLSPLVTSNEDFYRIDTALSIPQVDLETWTLRVHGLVENPYEIDFAQLLEMDLVESYVTLSCVSNYVGGSLVGNAKWLGVRLADVLDRAGVLPEGSQIVGRSVDGFTVGFPRSSVYDGREALVAVAMNDEPLPPEHGFPARLVVAGLYGYVSATKWLSDIEVTTWEAFDAYWVPRGWSKKGPIKTQSRIDTPRVGDRVGPGRTVIAGVAWAPNIGIERVEVQVDDGPWMEAELADSLDDDSWRQWRLEWEPEPGAYNIRVRATDRSGYTQTEDKAPPAPNGATGWHTIRVTAV